MRPLRPRFTVARLMATVALVALVLGAALWSRRTLAARDAYRFRADLLRDTENKTAAVVKDLEESLPGWRAYDARPLHSPFHSSGPMPGFAASTCENQIRYYRTRRKHFAALRRKYERAARYPWLPVAPDPPTPAEPKSFTPEYRGPPPIPPRLGPLRPGGREQAPPYNRLFSS